MDLHRYGPFADVVSVILALVAMFGMLLIKAFGRVRRWTWLIGDSPPFIVTGGIRALAIVLMAVGYLLVDRYTYLPFLGVAVVLGVASLALIVQFDLQRRIHVIGRPVLAADGSQQQRGRHKTVENLVVGTEATMREQAKEDFAAAQRTARGLTLETFLSGYGVNGVYETSAVWDREILARTANRLTLLLMLAFLSGVLALFLAGLCIDIAR